MNLLGPGLNAFLLGIPALLSIVNPLAGAIIFNEITGNASRPVRATLARKVGLNSAAVMLVSLWAGSYILNFFGITLNALRLAGGAVVASRAFQMLNAPEVTEARKQAQAASSLPAPDQDPDEIASMAFFPLTLPFTTGPGTIAVAVTLGTERGAFGTPLGAFFAGMSLAAVAIAAITWVSYAAADRLDVILGATGRRVLSRLAAFILLGIGVQIMLSGAIPVLHQALAG